MVKSGLEVHKRLYRDSANNYYAAIKEAKWAKIACSKKKDCQLFRLMSQSLNLQIDLVHSSLIKSGP